ncbi:MAG: hypothetical protein EBZ69_00730 [Alphaproteobacteria bacterium]|nr:hypothetical protein [Alphaproteobacteria bacterium]
MSARLVSRVRAAPRALLVQLVLPEPQARLGCEALKVIRVLLAQLGQLALLALLGQVVLWAPLARPALLVLLALLGPLVRPV